MTSLKSCQFLALGRNDFQSLLSRDDSIRETINRIGRERAQQLEDDATGKPDAGNA